MTNQVIHVSNQSEAFTNPPIPKFNIPRYLFFLKNNLALKSAIMMLLVILLSLLSSCAHCPTPDHL
jgi:ascorbate-specific PTS system EIIC-type component UlaA